MEERPKTISSKGEVVPKPYGPGRWHSPRRYACAHEGCDRAAEILVAGGVHAVDDAGTSRAHNCCGTHDDGEPASS